MQFNAANHRRQITKGGTSGAFCRPSAFALLAVFLITSNHFVLFILFILNFITVFNGKIRKFSPACRGEALAKTGLVHTVDTYHGLPL
jgi:hypothetical protein